MRRLAAAALAMALAGPSAATGPGRPVVEVVPPDPVEIAGDRTVIARVVVRVKPGYHVQANPVLDPALIPITLTLEPAQGLEVGTPRYPEPKRLRLRGAVDELVVLEGRFAIELPLRACGAAAGRAMLAGKLRYQACDDERCLFPRTLPVAVPVRVPAPPSAVPGCRRAASPGPG